MVEIHVSGQYATGAGRISVRMMDADSQRLAVSTDGVAYGAGQAAKVGPRVAESTYHQLNDSSCSPHGVLGLTYCLCLSLN